MSTSRGIFDNLSGNAPAQSPFAVVNEPSAPASPFAPVARPDSPFAVVDEPGSARSAETEKAQKLPERRKQDSPFQIAEASEGFGFEAPAKAFSPAPASPFEPAPVSSPFAPASQPPAPSPFSFEPAPAAPTPPPSWPSSPPPAAFAPAPAPAPAPVTSAAPAPASSMFSQDSDSSSIRQLELRAIFGVDREMSVDEILQRARSLPGIRHIARVGGQDMAAVEALKHVIANLGFGGGGIKLYAGSVPIEFIRESNVLLAVQTDGGFAPGVRETLMIVARELGRSA